MSQGICNQNTRVVKIDDQNGDSKTEKEIKTKDLDIQNNIIRICEEEHNKDQTKKYQKNSHINQVGFLKPYLDKDVEKQPVHHVYFGGNEEGKMPVYWVQFNLAGARHIPPGGGPPLYYEPNRNDFVRLVFSIVLTMLIVTAGFVFVVYINPTIRDIFRSYAIFIMIFGMVGMLGLNYAMMCSMCTRVPPCNYICLVLAVVFMSLVTAAITARYRTELVLLAVIATAATVGVCLGLAYTSFDFTRYLLYFVVIAVAFSVLALLVSLTMFVMNIRCTPLRIAILVIGTLISVVMLIMELQMILGGRAVELSEDDYALGAFMLYTSIIDLFLKLVQLLGILGND